MNLNATKLFIWLLSGDILLQSPAVLVQPVANDTNENQHIQANSPFHTYCQGFPGMPGMPGTPGHGIPGQNGEHGIPGLPGQTGEQGSKGDSGNNGEKGIQGEKGEIGVTGAKGRKGQQGFPGKLGPAGPVGQKGSHGPPGVGVPGKIGPKGQQGFKGDSGNIGEKGIQGVKGEIGIIGSKGQKGQQGIPGKLGPAGPVGQKGSHGPPGVGVPGTTGPKGEQGEPGPIGMPGSPGPVGSAPVQRRSAFTVVHTRYEFIQPSTGDLIIKLNLVELNIGSNYNASTGVFTSTIPGVYFFSYSFLTYKDNYGVVQLRKNGKTIVSSYENPIGYGGQGGQTVTIQLQTNDAVWIQFDSTSSTRKVYSNNNRYASFTGFLLYET